MELGPINVRETREIIELLDDDDKDVLNNLIETTLQSRLNNRIMKT